MMTDEPILRRKFQYTDLQGNNNKFWMVELWADGKMMTSWGRVGAAPQTKVKSGFDSYDVERLIDEKIAKGYLEVQLHKPAIVSTSSGLAVIDQRVEDFVGFVFRDAGQHIQTYLSVGVDALSQHQIDMGRMYLKNAIAYHYRNDKGRLVEAIQYFYKTIPTQLPRKIEPEEVVKQFVADFHEQEQRLDQLEAALATYTVQQSGQTSQLAQLGGTQIIPLSEKEEAYDKIYQYIQKTSGGARRLHNIFLCNIPAERAAYEAEKMGKSNIQHLFHGTRTHNVRHILRTGLIIPQTAANGSRFGRGIYFADMSKRSINYAGSNSGNLKVLFVCDVALGKQKALTGDDPYLTAAPRGYDSVWGQKSYSGMDEFIVYKPSQQTLRAIITLE